MRLHPGFRAALGFHRGAARALLVADRRVLNIGIVRLTRLVFLQLCLWRPIARGELELHLLRVAMLARRLRRRIGRARHRRLFVMVALGGRIMLVGMLGRFVLGRFVLGRRMGVWPWVQSPGHCGPSLKFLNKRNAPKPLVAVRANDKNKGRNGERSRDVSDARCRLVPM